MHPLCFLSNPVSALGECPPDFTSSGPSADCDDRENLPAVTQGPGAQPGNVQLGDPELDRTWAKGLLSRVPGGLFDLAPARLPQWQHCAAHRWRPAGDLSLGVHRRARKAEARQICTATLE